MQIMQKTKASTSIFNARKHTIGALMNKLERWPSALHCNTSVQGRKKKRRMRVPIKICFLRVP